MGTPLQSPQNSKKKRNVVRFSARSDIVLLKMILEHNPYDTSRDVVSSWRALAPLVSAACGKQFSPRAVRERSEYLLGKYKSRDLQELKKSGTEEELSEREQLVAEVVRLRDEFKVPPSNKGPSKKEVEEGKYMRLSAARSMAQSHHEDVTSPVVDEVEHDGSLPLGSTALDMVECDYVDNGPSSLSRCDVLPNEVKPSSLLTAPPTLFSTVTPSSPPLQSDSQSKASGVRQRTLSTQSDPGPADSHPQSSTPHAKRKKINAVVTYHHRETRPREWDLELKRLAVEQLKAENESRRITIEEARIRREEKRFDEFLKTQAAKDAKILELLDAMIERQRNS